MYYYIPSVGSEGKNKYPLFSSYHNTNSTQNILTKPNDTIALIIVFGLF